ncbi:reverse transcriptase domain-containing protein [Trichonephila clavipes]|nr:reverse transcriptase domain-containing protein [Trichonephila clavipes]
MKTLLENNEEIAWKTFLKLRSRFNSDSSLFKDYKLVVHNYPSENIIERVRFEEENLKHNTFYLPHRAVIRTDKTTSKLRIVFDVSSHAKAQLSLNYCLHTGLKNFIPNLFFLLIKSNCICIADIKIAFLMIEIDESEKDFTRFLWDENPKMNLEKKWLEFFRMTRVLFGVKSSPFLLEATIKHHLKEYVDIFSDTYNHLNKAHGTVAYLRIELNDENIISSFVASKSRVAPLKTLPIPRLELMGALLSASLSDKIATALKLPMSSFYWTDSSVVLFYKCSLSNDGSCLTKTVN